MRLKLFSILILVCSTPLLSNWSNSQLISSYPTGRVAYQGINSSYARMSYDSPTTATLIYGQSVQGVNSNDQVFGTTLSSSGISSSNFISTFDNQPFPYYLYGQCTASNTSTLVTDSAGNSYTVWVQLYKTSPSLNSQPMIFFSSKSQGGSWSLPTLISPFDASSTPLFLAASAPSLVIDNSGNITVIWQQNWRDATTSTAHQTIFASTKSGASWSAPTRLSSYSPASSSPPYGNCSAPALALDPNTGDIVAVWPQTYYVSSSNNFVRLFSSRKSAGVWEAPPTVPISYYGSTTYQTASNPKVAIDQSGDATVIWQQINGSAVQIFSSSQTSKIWPTPPTTPLCYFGNVSGNAYGSCTTSSLPQLIRDNFGNLWAGWIQQYNAYNHVFVKFKPTGQAWNSSQILLSLNDTTHTDCSSPNMAYDTSTDGFGMMWAQSYRDNTGTSLYAQIFVSQKPSAGSWDAPPSIPLSLYNPSQNTQIATGALAMGNGNISAAWTQITVTPPFTGYELYTLTKTNSMSNWPAPPTQPTSSYTPNVNVYYNATAPQVIFENGNLSTLIWSHDYRDNDYQRRVIFSSTVDPKGNFSTPAMVSIYSKAGVNYLYTDAITPDITKDSSGNLIAVWNQSYRSSPSTSLYSQIFTSTKSNGTWSPQTLISTYNPTGTNYQAATIPQVAADRLGNVVAVWSQSYRDLSSSTLYTQIFASERNGNSWSTPALLSTYQSAGTNYQAATNPQVASDNNGNFYAVWSQSYKSPSSGTLRSEIFASKSSGGTWSVPTLLSTYDSAGTNYLDATLPQIACDSSGKCTIVWVQYYRISPLYSNLTMVFASTYAGSSWSSPSMISTYDSSAATYQNATAPQIIYDNYGNLIATWSQSYNTGAGNVSEIFVTTRPKGGAWDVPPTTPISLFETSGTVLHSSCSTPQIRIDRENTAHIVWSQNYRESASASLYGLIYYSKAALTQSNGLTWSTPTQLSNYSPISGGMYQSATVPQIAISDLSNMTVTWQQTYLNQAPAYTEIFLAQNYTLLPPAHLVGVQKNNRFSKQSELVNEISFDPSPSYATVAYKLYRGDGTFLNRFSSSNLTYRDHNRKSGVTYTYYITTVDKNGNESSPSEILSIKPLK